MKIFNLKTNVWEVWYLLIQPIFIESYYESTIVLDARNIVMNTIKSLSSWSLYTSKRDRKRDK